MVWVSFVCAGVLTKSPAFDWNLTSVYHFSTVCKGWTFGEHTCAHKRDLYQMNSYAKCSLKNIIPAAELCRVTGFLLEFGPKFTHFNNFPLCNSNHKIYMYMKLSFFCTLMIMWNKNWIIQYLRNLNYMLRIITNIHLKVI